MKAYNKEEIKAVAADVFKRYPKAKKVAVTSDGTAFITDEGENAVKNHAAKNVYGKELQITNFLRDEFEEGKKPAKAEDLILAINALDSVEEIEALMLEESAGRNRKSVIDAAADRIKELKAE
jgi:hypothetical protein